MRTTTLVSALLSTAALITGYLLEGSNNANVMPDQIGVILCVSTVIAWAAYINIANRGDIIAEIRALRAEVAQLRDGIGDYGDQREADGKIDAQRDFSRHENQRPRGHNGSHMSPVN